MEKTGRISVFVTAIFLCGLGIAITTQANLGTTPISSLPYVLTFMTPLSFGTTTFIINILFLLFQAIILKDKFRKRDYLQIAAALFFGFFVDLGMHIASYFTPENYFEKILMLTIGSAILALGAALEIAADILYVPGEGIVRAISIKTGKEFGKIKIIFDISHCIIAIILSAIVLHSIKGLREGTVLAGFLAGGFIQLYCKLGAKFKNKQPL